ncbi:hypothetical protein HPB50_014668 [Hyalomma asiaticum]|uniref:Uncharacterized protein n=1 Tax=Hyalomma asiaticum TaxID=266040 RepID=A0ACB7S6I1_HYAAI|nr:hypothetical protein HPB50_014668 [Hyalomma asiaticum]
MSGFTVLAQHRWPSCCGAADLPFASRDAAEERGRPAERKRRPGLTHKRERPTLSPRSRSIFGSRRCWTGFAGTRLSLTLSPHSTRFQYTPLLLSRNSVDSRVLFAVETKEPFSPLFGQSSRCGGRPSHGAVPAKEEVPERTCGLW